MPYLTDYIVELKLGKNPKLESVFSMALKQVFTSTYLSKIELSTKKRIKLKEKNNKPNVIAWVEGTTIYINQLEFYKLNTTSQIKYLLHEFMHVMMNSKSFFILDKFKEMKVLSKNLWSIVKKHSSDPGKFLTGNSQKKTYLNSQEALSYLMNDKINWALISSTGKKLFIKELDKANMFNLNNEFWKKRLM